MVTGLFGQRPTIILTFTAVDSMAYIQVDSIKVMNRSQGVDTILNYPDTVLILEFPVGVHDAVIENKGFGVFQNYPNPVADQTTIALYVPEKDRVCLLVTNPIGQVVIMTEHLLDQGIHSFRFTPGGGNLYFFTAEWHGVKSTIKIICTGNLASGRGMMDYTGQAPMTHQTKTASVDPQFFFIPGDTLLFIGYADSLASGMLDSPEESHDYTFQFATNIPCPGTPIVEYAGQVYNTIQVFSQCWLKENLNVGEMIPGTMNQSNNGTIEKYCQFNDTSYCKTYGGLYQWDEMMQYTSLQGTQGICPPGWHIPTDEETKILEGATDSLFSLGDPEWDNRGYRGWDTGKNLKTIDGWPEDGGGTDLFGFSVLPGGYRKYDGTFHGGDYNAEIWSSTDDMINAPWRRRFDFDYGKISRNYNSSRQYGFSVRCIRDENNN
jgi:uncharacterized protein (TIGR02145 family)